MKKSEEKRRKKNQPSTFKNICDYEWMYTRMYTHVQVCTHREYIVRDRQ